MMHLCERCRTHVAVLGYNKDHDEYWCESCFDNEAEAAYERQQARDLENPSESAREEQLRTWHEKQKGR